MFGEAEKYIMGNSRSFWWRKFQYYVLEDIANGFDFQERPNLKMIILIYQKSRFLIDLDINWVYMKICIHTWNTYVPDSLIWQLAIKMNFDLTLIQKTSFLLSYLFKSGFSESNFLKTIILEKQLSLILAQMLQFYKAIFNTNKKAIIYSIEPNAELIKLQK